MKSLEDNEPNDLGNVNSHTFSDFVLLNYKRGYYYSPTVCSSLPVTRKLLPVKFKVNTNNFICLEAHFRSRLSGAGDCCPIKMSWRAVVMIIA